MKNELSDLQQESSFFVSRGGFLLSSPKKTQKPTAAS